MKSMTGFGRAVASADGWDASVDVSSVNRKGLEITCSLPRDWQGAERAAAQKVREFYSRGKVSVAVKFSRNGASAAFSVNEEALAASLAKLKSACFSVGADFSPDLGAVMALASRLEEAGGGAGWEEFWPVVEPALAEALRGADAMRSSEGAALAADFSSRLDALSAMVGRIREASAGTVSAYRDALLARLKNLGLELDLSDERVLKELSIFADKCDICEEITRLESHIGQFRSCLSSPENSGRKMDFICQEIGREINTVGSKANNLELTKIVIDFKNELERVREQAQNVE